MVGMVIVSHSRVLADSLRELVRQVANADIPLAVAAGIGSNRSEFGTDATEIMDAIQTVYSREGVVVLKFVAKILATHNASQARSLAKDFAVLADRLG